MVKPEIFRGKLYLLINNKWGHSITRHQCSKKGDYKLRVRIVFDDSVMSNLLYVFNSDKMKYIDDSQIIQIAVRAH